ncbi:MAG: transposase [Saprospiraceae bacterium]|nr:transposase [Saprospiraceae bacterium]
MQKYFYQGRSLPHWQPPGETFFITARLYGSIPKKVIENLKAEYQLALSEISKADIQPEEADDLLPEDLRQAILKIRNKKTYDASRRYFRRFDAFLESNLNEPHWLRQPEVARFNLENFHHYAERYFTLWAGTIMSNHIHLLLTLKPDAPILWKVLQDMKKYSATQSNKILRRSGHFWEHESYDHLVREGEFDRILDYILNNPVKAGIVKTWTDYPWTYCHPG